MKSTKRKYKTTDFAGALQVERNTTPDIYGNNPNVFPLVDSPFDMQLTLHMHNLIGTFGREVVIRHLVEVYLGDIKRFIAAKPLGAYVTGPRKKGRTA